MHRTVSGRVFGGPSGPSLADTLHARVANSVSAQPALNRTFWDNATLYVARHGTAPQLVGGGFNFDLDYLLRAPPSVLASLLTRRLANADLELATALGRVPLCSYHGPEGTRPSRIDGLLVDTRLAALPHAAEQLPRGAIWGHTPVCFDLHLRGASERVVKFVRPKPVVPAQREEREPLLLVQRVLHPLEAGWHAALAAALAYPVARIQAAQGHLREVLRWLERPPQGPGVKPRAVQQAWAALRRRLHRLRALGPEYANFEPGGAPGRLALLASLRRLSAAKVRATLRAEDKDRVRE